ncbi:aminodeoxychorismate synthase component I [Amycolatopsis antarctica]|uniref:Aminodeoxychorismate synthase component I n=1 Tax=Amycolatopsis antarctica TaxID=1854586 RepID=A0A263D559_9PSEU|nr:aminodeoxychorismate synthase component I [Amycolatopsis antarctica]OZM73511.1 aminodeoxychorismate synthase component I [Amycolatopsis antarctica]
MRLMRRSLRSGVDAGEALLRLGERSCDLGLAPPAALCGEWFGSRAVLAPALAAVPVGADEALAMFTGLPEVAGAVPGAVGGGWFGYLSYDLTDPSGRAGPLPVAVRGWTDHVLRLDSGGRWWFEALVADGQPDPDTLAGDLAALLDGPAAKRAGWTPVRLRRPPAEGHRRAVRACVEAIAAGELYQANVCARFDAPFDGAPMELFAEGAGRLLPRRAAYLEGDWGAVASMSPELFLARRGDRVRSTPIKGTLPRRGPADDGLAQRLRRSAKDVAENVMITDLVRNDLGRVCAVGSVRVPELLRVRAAPGVWHLESTVEGRTLVPDTELLRATFPPGSVTGAPKLRALDLIAELEPVARGVYTGAIGLASPVAGLELNVAIRSFELHAGHLHVGVGGGITAGSDAVAEWEECLHKAAPLDDLLDAPPR